MMMLDDKLCLTSVVEFLRRGRVDRGTIEGKVVVVVDSSKRKVRVIVSHIGLRGVFQYCVTRYLIVWPFLGALQFSTVLAVSENMTFECKRSRSRKARQSLHNLLKIVFHT